MDWFVLERETKITGMAEPVILWRSVTSRAFLRTWRGLVQSYDSGEGLRLSIHSTCALPMVAYGEHVACERTWFDLKPGLSGISAHIAFSPVKTATYRLGGKVLPGLFMRERIEGRVTPASTYLFDSQGNLLMSHQVLGLGSDALDVFAEESMP